VSWAWTSRSSCLTVDPLPTHGSGHTVATPQRGPFSRTEWAKTVGSAIACHCPERTKVHPLSAVSCTDLLHGGRPPPRGARYRTCHRSRGRHAASQRDAARNLGRYAFNEHEPPTASTCRSPADGGSAIAVGAEHGLGLRRAGGGAQVPTRAERGTRCAVAGRSRNGRRRGGRDGRDPGSL